MPTNTDGELNLINRMITHLFNAAQVEAPFIQNSNDKTKFASLYELGVYQSTKSKRYHNSALYAVNGGQNFGLVVDPDTPTPTTNDGADTAKNIAMHGTAGTIIPTKVSAEKAATGVPADDKVNVQQNIRANTYSRRILIGPKLGAAVAYSDISFAQNKDIEIVLPSNMRLMKKRLIELDNNTSLSLRMKGIMYMLLQTPLSFGSIMGMTEEGVSPLIIFPVFTVNIFVGHTIMFAASGGISARMMASGFREWMYLDRRNKVYTFHSESLFGAFRLPLGPSFCLQAPILFDVIAKDGNFATKDLSVLSRRDLLINGPDPVGYFTIPVPNINNEVYGNLVPPFSILNKPFHFSDTARKSDIKTKVIGAAYANAFSNFGPDLFEEQAANTSTYAIRKDIEERSMPMVASPFVFPDNYLAIYKQNGQIVQEEKKSNPLWRGYTDLHNQVFGSVGNPIGSQALPVYVKN
ncbi:MAG: hypothetical protein KGI25_09990 [Thaumarchaeota archaeon]|nr:hypothetical protein [Nitrososphaerota archaeon]